MRAKILLHVRFPWQRDVGALSRNNGIVQHCCVSLATQQCWTALALVADNNVNKQHCYARNNRQAFLWLRDWLSTETSKELVSCVLGLEEVGRTRRVQSAIVCN
jgi:hypothetical protein